MRAEQGVSIWTLLLYDVSLQAKEIPGIKIFRSSTTIYYTNAEMYVEALQEKVCACVSMNVDVCLIARCNPFCAVYNVLNCFHKLSLLSHFLFSLFDDVWLFSSSFFPQSGIIIGKLLTEKKKRDAKLKRKQEKEKKKAKKEAKKQVWYSK